MSRARPTRADAGLFGPDSVTWRIHGDPIMAVAGLRAPLTLVIKQLVTDVAPERGDPHRIAAARDIIPL